MFKITYNFTSMNPYKMTKSIRFKLETSTDEASQMLKETEALQAPFDLAKFISQVKNFIAGIHEYLFKPQKDKNDNLKLKGDFTLKKEWLKAYSKAELAEIKEKQSQNSSKRKQPIKLADMQEASEKVIQAFTEVENTLQELAKDATAELNERAKRERTGLLVKRLQERNILPLLLSLIENISSKSEQSDLRLNLIWQADELKTQLPLALAAFLPAQSNGIPVAKATFNYYTINKKPTDYKEKIDKQIKKLSYKNDNTIFDISKNKITNDKIKNAICNDIQAEMQKNNATQLLLGDIPASVKINNTYISLRQVLKNIKAKQKSQFNELMTLKDTTLQTVKNRSHLYLFHNITKKDFDEYKQKTEKLEEIATKINQSHSEEEKKRLRFNKEKIAKERGELLKNNFTDWKTFMELYRTVAQKHGKILSTLKGIEKERVESQLLKYWAVILQENEQHKLVLIPREKAKDAYECIKKNKVKPNTENISYSIYWFESFTYKSLQKLCFEHTETGINQFKPHIEDLFKKCNIQGEFSFKGDEQKKINFYKDVLKHKYTKTVLNLPFEQVNAEIINKKFETLDEFQIALEKICYKRFASFVQSPEQFLKNYEAEIFTITAYDLSKKSTQGKDKTHTQIWKEFWSKNNENNQFDIRLNPEITITYRLPKSSRIAKYGEKSKLYDPNKKNRYLYPQFTLITTMSEHSHSPTKNLSFTTEDEFKSLLDEFNAKFKKENIKFALGIDNGEVELSTLGVYVPDFGKDTPEKRMAELQNVQKYGFEVLTIKDLNYKEVDYKGKERKIIQNPSYFLIKENYMRTFNKTEQEYAQMFNQVFQKQHLLTLDLSTAKVIAGYIVANGDVPALFNLWMRHAQRNIYEMNDHIKQETAKKITLKNQLDEQEKWKFLEKISDPKKYEKLSEQEKQKYFKWIFEDRYSEENNNLFTKEDKKKFQKCQKRVGNFSENSGIVYAISAISGEIVDITDIFDVRNIFKKREEFFSLMTEDEIIARLNEYNTNRTTHNISNEELDLRIKNLKEALVANAVGVIDFIYKKYKERTGGEGLIVKEGFSANLVEKGLEKFSGNIYRILERKLYQKFQNYGLVPPIKSLLSVREEGIKEENDKEKKAIVRLGNIAFVSAFKTSQQCPKCFKENMKHGKKCSNCGFEATPIMHSNDGIAGFNIAKRGYENFMSVNTTPEK